jgi:hypothetical protein
MAVFMFPWLEILIVIGCVAASGHKDRLLIWMVLRADTLCQTVMQFLLSMTIYTMHLHLKMLFPT